MAIFCQLSRVGSKSKDEILTLPYISEIISPVVPTNMIQFMVKPNLSKQPIPPIVGLERGDRIVHFVISTVGRDVKIFIRLFSSSI